MHKDGVIKTFVETLLVIAKCRKQLKCPTGAAATYSHVAIKSDVLYPQIPLFNIKDSMDCSKLEKKARISALVSSSQCTTSSSQCNKARKRKDVEFGKEETQLSLLSDDMNVYVKYCKRSIK